MDLLFWSGGKDSYLALEFYRQEHPEREIGLLTTYNKEGEYVPHQNIDVSHIKNQAEFLNLPLTLVPLPDSPSNEVYTETVDEYIQNREEEVIDLVFGDWKLEDVREWRETVFSELGYTCHFPIWQKSIHDLLPLLILKPVTVTISSVSEEYEAYIKKGETYDQGFIRTLPGEIDPMGENGEFHTKITFHDLSERVV